MKNYTNSWFENWKKNFQSLTPYFSNRIIKCLEIGSFEGRSANWIVENWCIHKDSTLTCLDPFVGNVEHHEEQKDGLYERFLNNTFENRAKIRVIKDFSNFALPRLLESNEKFDFIYVDGDHHNLSVLLDAIYADKILLEGGILAFDDYLWRNEIRSYERPKEAIDYFFKISKDYYDIIITNYQVFARKKVISK